MHLTAAFESKEELQRYSCFSSFCFPYVSETNKKTTIITLKNKPVFYGFILYSLLDKMSKFRIKWLSDIKYNTIPHHSIIQTNDLKRSPPGAHLKSLQYVQQMRFSVEFTSIVISATNLQTLQILQSKSFFTLTQQSKYQTIISSL